MLLQHQGTTNLTVIVLQQGYHLSTIHSSENVGTLGGEGWGWGVLVIWVEAAL